MNQKTFCMLKPDIPRRRLIGEAIKELEKHFSIIKMELQFPNIGKMNDLYKDHQNKSFFQQMMTFMTSGPIVALELHGNNVVSQLRNLLGHFDPLIAELGTLRQKFAVSIDENSFHASDSEQSAQRELVIFFNEK